MIRSPKQRLVSTFHIAANYAILSSRSQDSPLAQQTQFVFAACYEHMHCHLITVPVERVDFETDDEYVVH